MFVVRVADRSPKGVGARIHPDSKIPDVILASGIFFDQNGFGQEKSSH